MRAEIRRPIAQELGPQLAHQMKILLPALVMAALLHLVYALARSVRERNHRVAILDPGSKHELSQNKSSNASCDSPVGRAPGLILERQPVRPPLGRFFIAPLLFLALGHYLRQHHFIARLV